MDSDWEGMEGKDPRGPVCRGTVELKRGHKAHFPHPICAGSGAEPSPGCGSYVEAELGTCNNDFPDNQSWRPDSALPVVYERLISKDVQAVGRMPISEEEYRRNFHILWQVGHNGRTY